jgi:hypothetical protein
VLDALFRQVLAGDAGKIAGIFSGEQHGVLEQARSFVVAALSPTGATFPTFFELAFFSQAMPLHLISII